MTSRTADSLEPPYHLRAPRLKWAAFAVTLEDDELKWVQDLVANTTAPVQAQVMANLLLSLHHREEISKVCAELQMSRRKLLELGDLLTSREGRRKLLSQPEALRTRSRRRS